MTHPRDPYIYVGQVNLFNKNEAGAELAHFANQVMSSFVHKEGTFTGFVKNGQPINEDNYKDRLSRIGIETAEDGSVVSYPSAEEREQYRAANRNETRRKRNEDLGVSYGNDSCFEECLPRSTLNELLGSTHRKRDRIYKSQKFGDPNKRKWTKKASSKPEGFLFALQEVQYVYNRIPNLRGHRILIDRSCEEPRAALFFSKNLYIWGVADFTNQMMATGLWLKEDGQQIYVVSLYTDGTIQQKDMVIEPLLDQLVRSARQEGREVLILADANAWNTLWGSEETNNRGEAWEGFIVENRLKVLNRGERFTYVRYNSQTKIDISLITGGLDDKVKEWRVRDAVACSDHCSIEMLLFINGAERRTRRNYDRADWDRFTELMEEYCEELGTNLWSVDYLNKATEQFTAAMQQCVEDCVPVTKVSQSVPGISWFSGGIIEKRKLLHTIKKYMKKKVQLLAQPSHPYWKNGGKNYTREDFTAARRDFKYACRKGKRLGHQDFVTECDNLPKVAGLAKMLRAEFSPDLGLLLKEGKICNPEETLNLLCDTHFPQNKKTTCKDQRTKKDTIVDIYDPGGEYISTEKVRASIDSFKPIKGCGPDELPPITFQHLGPLALRCLTAIYKASYLLQYVPNAFLDVRVVFIPKAGKKNYSDPRSFRPITLMNFMYKILEKVLLWDNEENVIKHKPFHNNQHGFRKGRSCDSALTSLTSRIEAAFLDKKQGFALCGFLDFTGAYDNLTNRSMLTALKKRGCKQEFIGWIFDFLKHRRINTSLRGVSLKCYPTKGAPQGAVTSPWLWNDVDDGFLGLFDQDLHIHTEGYADDCVLIITGGNVLDMRDKLQAAMNKAQTWALSQGLEFSASKTQVVLFTRKQKKSYTLPSKLSLANTELKFSEVTKHLGIWLDQKLSFKYHLDMKVKRCKFVIGRIAGAMGKFWGITPRLAMWTWKGIVRPMLTFGSLVWAKVCRNKYARDKLQSLQRQAFKTLAYFRRSTPTLGLEVMTNCPPLDLHLMCMAAQGLVRTRGHEKFSILQLLTEHPALKSHRQFVDEWLFEIGCNSADVEIDNIPREFCWNKAYSVDKSTMNRKKKKTYGVPKEDTVFAIYTDGSKINSFTGCGVAPYKAHNVVDGVLDGPAKELQCETDIEWESFHLGDVTVFQAEMFGILQAARYILHHAETLQIQNTSIAIYSDNQSVVKTLCHHEVNSELTLETITKLNEVVRTCQSSLVIRWCKGHVNHRGNNKADLRAKEGAEQVDLLVPNPPKRTYESIKAEIKRLTVEAWDDRWQNHCPPEARCRQTKAFFPTLNQRLANEIIACKRSVLSKIILVISGHNFLNYHRNIIDNNLLKYGVIEESEVQSAKCDLCYLPGQTEDSRPVQSSIHIFGSCEKFMDCRLRLFGDYEVELPFSLTLNQINKFLWETGLEILPMLLIEQEEQQLQALTERRRRNRNNRP